MNIKRIITYIAILSLAAVVLVATLVVIADITITNGAKQRVFDHIDQLPKCKTAMVLGTSKYIGAGHVNPYFRYRMEAAKMVWERGKCDYLIVSGDNSVRRYNEPFEMKKELEQAGVDEQAIYMDFAGFRTFDSVIRMREIFSQERYIIISQKFHNERAIYIANHYGMEVYGYNARDVGRRFGAKTLIREKFARVKVFLDIALGKSPKFLGEKIIIGEKQLFDHEIHK